MDGTKISLPGMDVIFYCNRLNRLNEVYLFIRVQALASCAEVVPPVIGVVAAVTAVPVACGSVVLIVTVIVSFPGRYCMMGFEL